MIHLIIALVITDFLDHRDRILASVRIKLTQILAYLLGPEIVSLKHVLSQITRLLDFLGNLRGFIDGLCIDRIVRLFAASDK